jgi:PD-(D/E)XK endonuclease
MKMRDTHGVGLVSHTAVLNRLVQLGFEVLIPWASHLGYDLAYYVVEEHRNFGFFVHREARLVRIQVKTGRLSKDGSSFDFNTVSVTPGKRENKTKGYVGKAEFFAIYLPDNRRVYMIAVNVLPSGGQKMGSMTLRFKSAGLLLGNGRSLRTVPYEEAVQMKYSLWWAEDYEI